VARHGETEWSLAGRHTGTTDLPLTAHGEEHAEALGAKLSVLRFDAVYSSPLQRALRTAELAGFDRVQVTPLLREVDYGQYEGLTSDEIHQTNPGWELYRDGSPGGETPAQILARAEQFIDVATGHRTGGRIIAFAHGHILRAVAVAWIGAPITTARGLQLDSATLNILRDGDRGRVLALWNAE
jgi:broad specificity phosphatase PhoE